MEPYRYRKADAFTGKGSLGNPAACIYLEENQTMPDETMQRIAQEHRGFVSEMAFCTPNGDSFDMAYYSSECEVEFCGHGTIACLYGLIKETPELRQRETITLNTRKKGSLTAYNELESLDAVYISAPQALHLPLPVSREETYEALGLEQAEIFPDFSLDFIDAGNRTLIVPVDQLDDEISLFPSEDRLREFSLRAGIDVILIFSKDTRDDAHFAHTRVFAAKFGYLEDPATGSANCAFGYYLLKNGLWNGDPISLEQGGCDRAFNTVKLKTVDGKLVFGGSATTRIAGVYFA